MALTPSPQVLKALQDAAAANKVPLALLWGVAFAASRFDPSNVELAVGSDDRHLGLMGLTPAALDRYAQDTQQTPDPLDPVVAADIAAKLLAHLYSAFDKSARDTLSAYWVGANRYLNAKRANAGISTAAELFVRQAMNAIEVYRNNAKPPFTDQPLVTALASSWEALRNANPTFAPVLAAYDKWKAWHDIPANADMSNERAVLHLGYRAQWEAYKRAYEAAPITTAKTMRPEWLSQDGWKVFARDVERAKEALKDAGKGLAEIGIALAVFALLAIGLSSNRGARR